MRIVTTYGGEPFKIVGWARSYPFEPVLIGWTRSPQNREFLRELGSKRNYETVQMQSVKNRKTGDA